MSGEQVCGTAFVEAMRARLIAEDPAMGPNVDRPDVRPNLDALGSAVFHIVDDSTLSDAARDPVFWGWVDAVNAWLAGLSAWQTGVAGAFATWTPATAAETSLKTAVVAVPAPGPPPAAAPAELRVTVR